jgi:hypothetical protein
MAAPVITSVTVTYPAGQTSLVPGQSATITVVATDPDNRIVTVTVVVADASGATSVPTPVTVVVNDPLTYTATADSGTVVPVAGSPGKFTYTA